MDHQTSTILSSDAHFAPLKPRHQYLLGLLLLVRGILQVMFASSFTIPDYINLILLLVIGVLLLVYVAYTHPYKSTAKHILQLSFLMNLTLLGGFFIFAGTQSNKFTLQAIGVGLSTGVAFLHFCGIVLHAIISSRCSKTCKRWQLQYSDLSSTRERPQAQVQDLSLGYRDSIMNESQQLLVPTY